MIIGKILNWLKGKYWLWGVMFGLALLESAGIYHYFTASFARWDYRFAFTHGIILYIFFAIVSELFFRTLKKFKSHPSNNSIRIILLIFLIIFFLLILIGILGTLIIPFAD